ncbi:MAG: helix-turn-helix domain-containing protein [Phycisphaeraceae bacterium]|nr:helix-turn-helix domain-containing protein [Phycisphaeraceae bacterium]
MQTVGQRIRTQREQLGLTLSALAARAEVAVSYLSMIENHRVDNPPSAAVLGRLEAALQMRQGELQRAAAWQRAPGAVLDTVQQLADQAQRGRDLAQWLNQVTPRRGGLRRLDQLYRSGALRRRIQSALAEDESQMAEGRGQRADGKQTGEAQSAISHLPSAICKVPLINKVAAGYPRDFTDLDYPARVADDYVPAYGIEDPDAFAAAVVGASMEPAYREGDVVVFSPLADVFDGCDCFVRLEPDHESTFKRIFFDGGGSMIRLQPLNPTFAPRIVKRGHVAGLYRAVLRISRL